MRFVVVGRHTGVEVVRLVDQLGLTELSPAGMLHRYFDRQPLHLPGTHESHSAERWVTRTLMRTVVADALSTPRAPDRWILEWFPRTVDDARWLSALLDRQRTPVTAALVAEASSHDRGEHARIVAFFGSRARPLSGFLD